MASTAMTVVEKAHSVLGASSADKWMNCPGSVEAERGLPNPDTPWTREGTAAHHLSELAFEAKRDPEAWMGETITVDGHPITVSQEMVDATRLYLNIIRQMALAATKYWMERQFSLAPLKPASPVTGTSDFTAWYQSQRLLDIVDLKYGKGVRVDAQGNKQGRVYALGVWLELAKENRRIAESVEYIRITIVQPRILDAEGNPSVTEDTITLAELKAFGRELLQAARKAMTPGIGRVAGDKQCQWCRAKATCKTMRDTALAGAQIEFSDVVERTKPLNPDEMSLEDLASVLLHKDLLESWLHACETYALTITTAGQVVPGFARRVKGKHRAWAKDKDVIEWAKKNDLAPADIMTPPKVRSPAQIETHLRTTKSGVKLPKHLLRAVDEKQVEYVLCRDTDPNALKPGITEFESLEPPQES